MSLDLRNFVQVNIHYNQTNISTVTRGIVTLITVNNSYSADPYKGKTFYSLSQYKKAKEAAAISETTLDKYVETFFKAKGKALEIRGGYAGDASGIQTFVASVVDKLTYDKVLIVSDCDEADLREVAKIKSSTTVADNPITGENTVSTFAGINEKIFIACTADPTLEIADAEALPNYLLKVMNEPASGITVEKGFEMLAAGYLSAVSLSDSTTIADYNFTIEDVSDFIQHDQQDATIETYNPLIEDNDEGVELMNKHFNFNTTLVNATRNIGGDTISGADAMNYYIRILVAQVLTERIIRVLTSKIRANQSGISKVANAISQEMNVFISNGYLNTDYIWTEDDLYYSYNGRNYLICSKNTPLVKGYRCVILPTSALTEEQREAHAFPPIYILLADQQSVRAIVLNGDVY